MICTVFSSQFFRRACSTFSLEAFTPDLIRNFSIIAHVDHGKSTLADRLLELAGVTHKHDQALDTLPVERQRGITVKAQTASLVYQKYGRSYLLNLIDTPGHVDFSFEVARSLAACNGVVLLVDANEGVQAQTIANFYLAFEKGLTVVPAVNKIDLPNAKIEGTMKQMTQLFDVEENEILKISAKRNYGIDQLLDEIVARIPAPTVDQTKSEFACLLFDSWYVEHKGVICHVAVKSGNVRVGDHVSSLTTKKSYIVKSIGILKPEFTSVNVLSCGQIGVIILGMKTTSDAVLGDIIFHTNADASTFQSYVVPQMKPIVYAGIYPTSMAEYGSLKSALQKLTLNDNSVHVQDESSLALGKGWRLGFLGVLHLEVFIQRLELEHGVPVIVSTPSVPYRARLKYEKHIKQNNGEEVLTILNADEMPLEQNVSEFYEPFVLATVITPQDCLRAIVNLLDQRRGVQQKMSHLTMDTVLLTYEMPLSELITDLFSRIKSISSGYASLDYEETGYRPTNLVKLSVLLNKKPVSELTSIVHESHSRKFAEQLVRVLMEHIPRQLFHIAIQVASGSTIIARGDLKPLKKNVTAKLYGGDVTRKMKLLRQQAEGKKQMRLVGNVQVPRNVFLQVFKR